MPSNPDTLTDEELMSRLCSATDRETSDLLFTEVFGRYHNRVISWCYRLARDRDAAGDLAQEVMLKAYRHRDSFRGDSRLSTWLYAIARNHCLTAMKRQSHAAVQLDLAVHTSLRDTAAVEPDLAAEQGELWALIMQLMSRTLEPLEVRVMTLHYGHEIPLAVITRRLDLRNPSGAKAYIVNARRKLHGVLRRRGWKSAVAITAPCKPDYLRGAYGAAYDAAA